MITKKSIKPRQHSPHDEIFKRVFKNKKYLIELLDLLFSAEKFEMFDLENMTIEDSTVLRGRGGELRTDLSVSIPLRGVKKVLVVLSLTLEHKSYSDPDADLQAMDYHIQECKAHSKQRGRGKNRPYRLIIPVILLCCEDRDYEPPSDYLSWEFGSEDNIPPELKKFAEDLPLTRCKRINLRKLPEEELWTKALCSAIVIYAMGEVWDVSDATVGFIVDRIRQLPDDDAWELLISLIDYYESADTGMGRADFDRVDRARHPGLKEEDRLMPAIEFSLDKAVQRGEQLGLQKGEQLGLQKGEQLGLQKGEQLGLQKGRQEVALRLLRAGVDEKTVRNAAQISAAELRTLKRKL